MGKLNPRYRYPIFFTGLLILICAGFIYKFGNNIVASAIAATVGFIIFISSLVL